MENQMVFKRYELKYLITRQQQQQLLKAMEGFMAADRFGHSSIRNLYYDTPSFLLIRRSLEKPLYKEKIRVRSYGRATPQDPVFVELKKKYDSVVYKRRIEIPQKDALEGLMGISPLPETQIGREIQIARDRCPALSPRVFLSYERDAFYATDGSDFRVTFDQNIRFRTEELTLDSECWGTSLLESEAVLMELKLPYSIPIWMARELSRMGIYKTTFSKYGAAYQQMQPGTQRGVLLYA